RRVDRPHELNAGPRERGSQLAECPRDRVVVRSRVPFVQDDNLFAPAHITPLTTWAIGLLPAGTTGFILNQLPDPFTVERSGQSGKL
ncbi:hypothetical protein, partial [Amycolatopsis mediterranei]|uniref:hypothetical protein n=1 Tax=Amycolatopsis mediterranei TaxID=33910 RepID=UPI001EE696E6